MASVSASLRQLRCKQPALGSQWLSTTVARRASPSTPLVVRTLVTTTTTTPSSEDSTSRFDNNTDLKSQLEAIRIPHRGVTHARAVPATPSYFSRTPQFNDLHIQLARLLARHNHLPTLPSAEAAQMPWLKLEAMRRELGESIKASHFSQVMRVVRRLHCIEPSLAPDEVKAAVARFTKPVNALLNILVNGKTLSEAFGRVHDRESAVWALMSTGRVDKYNIWALVEGGGTTGQAEAMTMAVAKGLLAHEPALKPALRKAGCITRDPRKVERKLHGHVKARKSPAWVKR
ncbi:hypothetical protein LLEC1_02810 [Akanthomyces lecanii]|uniref:Ribosomal protein S5 C-terminal domain-containing protein n=1 Tax=Cordyceps confragosa TaxID=2714763 RepID=A0A179I3E0_CORDF|nr:hypothetical protein LLEC1_02810 [Akanthomyces lecanii]